MQTPKVLKVQGAPVFDANCSTRAHQEHEVCMAYYYKDTTEELKSRFVSYRGANCFDLFMNDLTVIAIDVFDYLEHRAPMNALTDDEEENFHAATICHICKKVFKHVDFFDEDKSETRVRDHCHISGQYRGAAHNKCNLQ